MSDTTAHHFHSEAALQTILDASPVGIVVFDENSRIVFANPLAEGLFGPAHAELPCGDFIRCRNRSRHSRNCGHTGNCPDCPLNQSIQAACSDDPDPADLTGEVQLEREPGLTDIWIKFKVSGIGLHNRRVAVMALEDISERKKNEATLQQALVELSVIHEYAPIAMMLLDQDRRMQKVNGFAARFAERPPAEMIGKRGGEALRCLHHMEDPRGCGFGSACAECRVRQAVLDTFATGDSLSEIEAWLPFPRGQGTEERCLMLSTAYLLIGNQERDDRHQRYRLGHGRRDPGAHFRAFFYDQKSGERDRTEQATAAMSGSATILVVEDDPAVRRLAASILQRGGYRVVDFDSVEAAIEHAATHSEPIDLVLSDVVMPNMKGPEVFAGIAEHLPEARDVYMSGYTDNVIVRQGILKEGVQFIQKPFTVNGLLEKVWQVLQTNRDQMNIHNPEM